MNPDATEATEQAAPVEPAAPAEPATPAGPATPAEPTPPAPTPTEEIVVWGRLAVDQARDAVVRRVEGLGYRVARREDGVIVLRSGDWRGKVFVGADGTLDFTHPVAGFGAMNPDLYTHDPRFEDPTNLHSASLEPKPGPSFWLLPSPARKQGAEQQVWDATAAERAALRTILTRTEEEEWLEALPGRLDGLWTAGTPLSTGSPPVADGDRRAALLGYWAALPDDPFGQRATRVVERWMLNAAIAPATPDERARYEAARADHRPLPGGP